MTLSEALVEVYEGTDEQSDWDIYTGSAVDLTKTGSVRIARLLKAAQRAVAVWKFPDGRRLRFRCTTDELIAAPTVSANIVDSGGTYPGNTLPLVTPVVASALERKTLFVGDAADAYPVVSNTTNAAVVAIKVESDPADEAIVISSQRWDLTMPTGKELIQVVGLWDIGEDHALLRAKDQERFDGGALELDRPTRYVPTATGVIFDVCPDEASIYYRVLFQRHPLMPTTADASFELPLAFHDAIVEHAKYSALMRIGKSESAQMAWARLQSIMASIRQEADLEEDFVDRSLEVTSWR